MSELELACVALASVDLLTLMAIGIIEHEIVKTLRVFKREIERLSMDNCRRCPVRKICHELPKDMSCADVMNYVRSAERGDNNGNIHQGNEDAENRDSEYLY